MEDGSTAASGVLMAVHEEVFRVWPALAKAIADRGPDLQVRTRLRREANGGTGC